jgi:ParB-like chromosome segregation protein Spo0J
MAQHDLVELAADQQVDVGRFDLKNLEQLSARSVAISSLVPGVYLRQGGTNAGHVQLLLGAAGSSELPPILVQEHGRRVIDGLHRLEAARLRGDETISARLLDCTDMEALVLAIKSNTIHGLPLSKADRVSGAKHVLDTHPDWSDRAIACVTGLSANTIGSLRSRSGDGAQLSGKRLGRDGRRRPVTVADGRRRAAEYIRAHPDASLRQVAREADVSLGTVHDVSTRVRRGMDPFGNARRVSPAPVSIRSDTQACEPAQIADPAPQVSSGMPAALAGMPASRRQPTAAPPTWAAISLKVAGDPAIRYTEGGKEFLRWMALHAVHPDRWREFMDAIPAHWLSVIAPLADNISGEWSLFAERLRSRQGADS